MKPVCFKGKAVPVWLICLLIVPLTISVAYAASSIDTVTGDNIATIGGEVVTVAEDVSVTPGGVSVCTTVGGVAAAGTSDGSEEVMDDVGTEAANEALTYGNFTYDCTIAVVTVTNDKEYTAVLEIDGAAESTLYIEQDAAAVIGDDIVCTWDLGTSLSGGVYVVTVLAQ
jgi:hypothetical protein